MLAAVLHNFNQLVLEDVSIPEPKLGQVVVRIKACGICATDVKAIKGIRRNVTFPFIAGHEPSGIVARVGPGVTHFREGDEVICQPSGYCGFCKHCRVGNTHYCEHAFTTGRLLMKALMVVIMFSSQLEHKTLCNGVNYRPNDFMPC